MRRRIGNIGMLTGLGNSDLEMLSNKWTGDEKRDGLIKSMLEDGIRTFKFFHKMDGVDFGVEGSCVMFGIEPSYMYEHLYIVGLNRNKKNCYIKDGIAWGPYGSGISQKYRFYGGYKTKSKFVRFVDRWHSRLFR